MDVSEKEGSLKRCQRFFLVHHEKTLSKLYEKHAAYMKQKAILRYNANELEYRVGHLTKFCSSKTTAIV